ncbi:MAG: hypothetical protein HY699_11580, partial [Deltaproteobacteria bacterium]|nr:hypothetical protein [Deltaproteobacteria bacterium]
FMPGLPLDQDRTVVVQLKTSDGVCWEDTYSAKAVVNRATMFVDRGD